MDGGGFIYVQRWEPCAKRIGGIKDTVSILRPSVLYVTEYKDRRGLGKLFVLAAFHASHNRNILLLQSIPKPVQLAPLNSDSRRNVADVKRKIVKALNWARLKEVKS